LQVENLVGSASGKKLTHVPVRRKRLPISSFAKGAKTEPRPQGRRQAVSSQSTHLIAGTTPACKIEAHKLGGLIPLRSGATSIARAASPGKKGQLLQTKALKRALDRAAKNHSANLQ